jgi:hypothetical protein
MVNFPKDSLFNPCGVRRLPASRFQVDYLPEVPLATMMLGNFDNKPAW